MTALLGFLSDECRAEQGRAPSREKATERAAG